MAPSKKKKKPASNPARGFATTSTASKPKYDRTEELDSNVQIDESGTPAVLSTAVSSTRPGQSSSREPEKALCELTPEELESQLEESTLQLLVENQGEKTKKDVSRHVARLQTEKRLLRSQAEYLHIRQWLPPEIMQIITSLLQAQEDGNSHLPSKTDTSKAAPQLSEDELLIKLWALKRLLPLLGFSEQRTDLAIRHVLTLMKTSGPQNLSSGKDTVWGLDECLAWLALNSGPTDLSLFDSRERQSHCSADTKRSEIVNSTTATDSTESRPESPLSNDSSPRQAQTSDEDSILSSASDLDSDAEPEHLIAKYLELQSQLHKISPELTEIRPRRQRRAKDKPRASGGNLGSAGKRRIERLTAKISKIKSDLLFDEDEANSKWAEIRIDLAQEAAERKRLGMKNDEEQPEVIRNVRSNNNPVVPNDDDDDTEGMLGGFFSSLPETTTDPATGLSIMSTTSQEGTMVEIRDFGDWNGMSPRRVLEEACKARWDFYCV